MTPEQLKQKFRREGLTFTAWAKENGYHPRNVIRLVNGFDKGHFGKAHEIAVKLGLKPGQPSAKTK